MTIRISAHVLHHGQIKRKVFSSVACFAVSLGLLLNVNIEAHAISPVDVVIDFMVNGIEHFGQEATNAIEDMDGDEFYNWWSDKSDFDSDAVKALMLAASTRLTPYGVRVMNTNLTDQFGLLENSHANVAKVKQDILDDIAELVSTGGVVPEIDGELYGITTEYPIVTENLDRYGDPLKEYDGSDNFASWGCYETLQGLNETNVYIFHCSGTPPFIKVGSQTTVYHYGNVLPTGFYMVLDDETLLPAPYETSNSYPGYIARGCCITYRTTPNSNYSTGAWYSISRMARFDSNSGLYYYNRSGSMVTQRIVRGVQYGYENSTDILFDYQNAALRTGGMLHLNGEAPYITPPADIPYDSNGDVYMIYNTDNGDTVYMSTGDYNNYVNNGTIVEGDYNQTLNETTINNIRNIMYPPESDTDSGTGGGSADLGVIEGLLRDIKNLLGQIKDKINLDDKITILDGTFGSEPVYEDFSDCVTENVPLIADVVDVVESLSPESANNGETEIGTHAAPPGAVGVQAVYDGFTIDLGWYAPYRQKIRDVLTIVFYGFGLVCCFAYVKSCFGVASGGGASTDV